MTLVKDALEGFTNLIKESKSLSEGERLQLMAEIQSADHVVQSMLSKDGINIEDSKSASWFQSHWRPFLGWVLAVGVLVVFTHAIIRSFIPSLAPLDAIVYETITLLATLLFGIRGAEKIFTYQADSKYNSPKGKKP